MDQPRTIAGYTLLRELGRGGMGVVYEGQRSDGQRAAIKVLRSAKGERPPEDRFAREGRIRVEHPNVVRTLESGVDDGDAFIVFELLDGEDLDQYLERNAPLTASDAVRIIMPVVTALAAAHDQGVLHRDVKPGNIFLCRDGSIKILDFGLAFVANESAIMTSEGAVMGTPAYLAP